MEKSRGEECNRCIPVCSLQFGVFSLQSPVRNLQTVLLQFAVHPEVRRTVSWVREPELVTPRRNVFEDTFDPKIAAKPVRSGHLEVRFLSSP